MKPVLMLFSALLVLTQARAQVVNGNFETWEGTGTAMIPTGWELLPGGIGWSRESDAHTGSYALKVSVWYYYTDTKVEQWAAISYRPSALNGWYKYTENTIKNQTTGLTTDDTAFATVYLTKWNTVTMMTDTVGRGQISLLGTATYTSFSCPITYSSAAIPDTVVVSMDPSMMRNGGNYFSPTSSGYNSFLTIDDISLAGPVTDVTQIQHTILKIWPNPTDGQLVFFMTQIVEGDIIVSDMAGRIVAEQPLTQGYNYVELTGVCPGTYVVSVNDKVHNTVMKQTVVYK